MEVKDKSEILCFIDFSFFFFFGGVIPRIKCFMGSAFYVMLLLLFIIMIQATWFLLVFE